MNGRGVGIDLGTTSSVFAILDHGGPRVLTNREGRRATPSAVSVADDGSRLAGKPAASRAASAPDRTVRSVTRRLADRDDVVAPGSEAHAPERVAATILRRVREDAGEALGGEVNDAVVTVPARFDSRQRRSVAAAASLAGFDRIRVVDGSTAAAVWWGFDGRSDRTVLVFDLGGGTFDVSIVDLGGGVYEVAAKDGDVHLGGDDWDRAIVDWLAERRLSGLSDLREDPRTRQRLRDAAERARIELSSRGTTTVSLSVASTTDSGPVPVEETLTRARFESLTSDLVERTVGPTRRALGSAGYGPDDVDEVLLVGGATRMPQVRETVEAVLGVKPRRNVDPDEAAALGAAIHAGVVEGEVDDIVVLDVTPLSLGVEVEGGSFERLIDRNTTIPTEESKVFTTAADDQTSVDVRVCQGEREVAERNELLGGVRLTGIPPAPAGVPRIEVSLGIDENGIVRIEAEDEGSGRVATGTADRGVNVPYGDVPGSRDDLRPVREESDDAANGEPDSIE